MKRKQLTLFLDEEASESIEFIRKKYNPEQYKLIKSHITLCREDEIENLEAIQKKLENIEFEKFELHTNGLKRFSKGKGLFIDIKDEKQQFKKLRAIILQNGEVKPREHQAHITLMHPRNSTCDDIKHKEILKIDIPKKFSFSKISLIEQKIGKVWKTLKEYKLNSKN